MAPSLRSRSFNNKDLVDASMKEFFAPDDKNCLQCEIKEPAEMMLHPAYSQKLPWIILLVLIHGSLLAITKFQQQRPCGCFNEGVLCSR